VKTSTFIALVCAGAAALAAVGCSKAPAEPQETGEGQPSPAEKIPGHDTLAQDTAPKEGPRMVPPEAYLRTYLRLFGDKKPLEAQVDAKTKIGGADMKLFDSWGDYLALLGLPDYAIDIPRNTQTNTLMLATFERLGIALCDRAVERELKAMPAMPVAERRVFPFEVPADPIDEATFTKSFDLMHRTFIGYPAALAVTKRTDKFFDLYQGAVDKYSMPGAPKTRFVPAEAGWAAVCYGLVRHPEFHLY
jgi:hypothetical protein